MQIRIATRKSALALWQAEHVAELLAALPAVDDVSLVPLSTRGDEILDRSLQKIGGKGLFIKELEVAMQQGRADIAVHSMKDVPAEMPDGFCLAAMLERASPFDALVTREAESVRALPQNAVVGTSSLRRQAQLLAVRPDLRIEPLRGNVNTRLARFDAGDYDAIILACAGLERLGLAGRISAALGPDEMLPAAAQGVVGIECRSDDEALRATLARLEHADSLATSLAERAVSERLGASCQSPVAAYATLENDVVQLTAMVASEDGRTVLRDSATGSKTDAPAVGAALAERLLQQGAGELLARDQ